jgi:hypothetical protein
MRTTALCCRFFCFLNKHEREGCSPFIYSSTARAIYSRQSQKRAIITRTFAKLLSFFVHIDLDFFLFNIFVYRRAAAACVPAQVHRRFVPLTTGSFCIASHDLKNHSRHGEKGNFGRAPRLAHCAAAHKSTRHRSREILPATKLLNRACAGKLLNSRHSRNTQKEQPRAKGYKRKADALDKKTFKVWRCEQTLHIVFATISFNCCKNEI